MPRKPKFRPVITRIKLNPEQAVLACDCYNGVVWDESTGYWAPGPNETYCVISGTRPFTETLQVCQVSGEGLAFRTTTGATASS